jgi:hypothetical protein
VYWRYWPVGQVIPSFAAVTAPLANCVAVTVLLAIFAPVTAPLAMSTVAIVPSTIAAELTVFAPAIVAAIPKLGITIIMAAASAPTNFLCMNLSPILYYAVH